jgi:hypothetical protein
MIWKVKSENAFYFPYFIWSFMPIPKTGREVRLTTLSTCAG